ncbi:MAG TPA: metallopeptidase family protein [Candidatus Saccharimonadales bacterium]|nr:metallopeptidase family protein [Candidatus Saccharimonadales bacterium]
MPKRRRGYRPPSSYRRAVRHAPFEELVERALSGIPAPFSRALRDVAIVIADEPTDEELDLSGLSADSGLYGLYEGTPRTEWGADFALFPNKITLYRLPLEDDFPDPAELENEVRETVIHELAHHLGIDDERLHHLGHR